MKQGELQSADCCGQMKGGGVWGRGGAGSLRHEWANAGHCGNGKWEPAREELNQLPWLNPFNLYAVCWF